MSCLQTGKGYLQPNDAFSMPSVVKYGLSFFNLSMTATGTAQVCSLRHCAAPVHSVQTQGLQSQECFTSEPAKRMRPLQGKHNMAGMYGNAVHECLLRHTRGE